MNGTGTLSTDGGALAAGASLDVTGNGNVDLTGDETIDTLLVNTSGAVDVNGNTLEATTSIDLDAGNLSSTGGVGITQPGIFRTAAYTQSGGTVDLDVQVEATSFTFDNAGPAFVHGILADNGVPAPLVKNGVGTTTLSNANTYTGDTTVNAGILDIVAGGSILFSNTVNVTGGELQTAANALSDMATVTVSGTGLYDVNGDDTILALDLQAGTVDVLGGVLTTTTFTQTGGNVVSNPAVPPTSGPVPGIDPVTGKLIAGSGQIDLDGNINSTYTAIAVGGTAVAGADRMEASTAVAGNNAFIQTQADVTTTAAGPAIETVTNGGQTIVNLGGNVDASGFAGLTSDGIQSSDTSVGNILVTGTGNVTGSAVASTNAGIWVGLGSGLFTSDLQGDVTGGSGIYVESFTGGSANIMGTGAIDGTQFINGTGVHVASTGGNGNIVVMQDGVVRGEDYGVNVSTTDGFGTGIGTVLVTAVQDIIGDDDGDSFVDGVQARTDLGQLDVNGAGNISGADAGIDAVSQGGNVNVTGSGTTSADDFNSETIDAQSQAGNGNVVVNRTGAITNTGGGTTTGINASAVGAGTVSVTNTGGVTVNGAGSSGTGINTSAVDGITTITMNGANVFSHRRRDPCIQHRCCRWC